MKLGVVFRVKWLKVQDLPFYATAHLLNSFNDNLPVMMSTFHSCRLTCWMDR